MHQFLADPYYSEAETPQDKDVQIKPQHVFDKSMHARTYSCVLMNLTHQGHLIAATAVFVNRPKRFVIVNGKTTHRFH